MNTNDLRTYRLLEEIEKSQPLSQRELANKLNISLGLVNAFIKRLAKMGLFKITTIPKNRVKYILTPKGVSEKTRLTYQYIRYSFNFYRDAREKIRVLFSLLEDEGVKDIVFWGVSDLAEIAYVTLQETDLKLLGIIDEQHAGQKFLNDVVLNPSALLEIDYDAIIHTDLELIDQTSINSYGVSNSKFKSILS